jgi:hypothetical protein
MMALSPMDAALKISNCGLNWCEGLSTIERPSKPSVLLACVYAAAVARVPSSFDMREFCSVFAASWTLKGRLK